jgi:RimJ/RimL family protein N-acetyltransferase
MPLLAPGPIVTERLLLRPLDVTDLMALSEVNSVDEVTRYLPYATWKGSADGVAWFERMVGLQAGGTALQFVITEKASNIAIGTVLLFNFDEASARAELGYVLGRAHWGRGLMREALEAMIGCAFGPMALRRLEATIDPRNERSARLLSSLTFQTEGLQRKRWANKGELQDSALFGLLRHDWEAR